MTYSKIACRTNTTQEGEKMGIKYMTVFGWPKTPGIGAEEGAKAFKKFGEELKKNNCKLLF